MLERPEADRAALVGRLYRSEGGKSLAEILADVESDPDDLVRLRLIGALHRVLDRGATHTVGRDVLRRVLAAEGITRTVTYPVLGL